MALLALGQAAAMFTMTELEGGFEKYISTAYSFEAALNLMADQGSEIGQSFRSELNAIIGTDREGFDAVYWECPPCTSATLGSQKFEFVLLPTNELTQPPISLVGVAFIDKLVPEGSPLAVEFANIGGDSVLVSPVPEVAGGTSSTYSHLKAFLQTAPSKKIDAWWAATASAYGRTVQDAAGKKVWLSTHGGGVEYLHARIDRRPKYYHYGLYKDI